MAFAGGTLVEACVTASDEPSDASREGMRHALLVLREAAESYNAAILVSLADHLSGGALESASELEAVRDLGQLLMRRDLTDAQLAAHVKQLVAARRGAPAPEAGQIVPIESLLYRGHAAVARARVVRDALAQHWVRGTVTEPAAHALFEELSDLLNLAVSA
jgi:hypothetical protein